MCAKADAFDAAGYVFDYRYATYVNIAKKTLFSHLFVAEHSAEDIENCIGSAHAQGDWRFFCTVPTSQPLRQKIIDIYEGRRASDRG